MYTAVAVGIYAANDVLINGRMWGRTINRNFSFLEHSFNFSTLSDFSMADDFLSCTMRRVEFSSLYFWAESMKAFLVHAPRGNFTLSPDPSRGITNWKAWADFWSIRPSTARKWRQICLPYEMEQEEKCQSEYSAKQRISRRNVRFCQTLSKKLKWHAHQFEVCISRKYIHLTWLQTKRFFIWPPIKA